MKNIPKITVKIAYIVALIIAMFFAPFSKCYANNANNANDSSRTKNNEEISKQQSEFGVQDFLRNSKEFAGDFFEDLDIEDVLNNAIKGEMDNSTIGKKILSLLGEEFVTSLKTIGSVLAIIVIHSVLKAISDNLENQGVSKLIFYVQYILIITIIMANFSNVVKLVQDTTTNLVAFMNLLVPLLITLMMSTGSIATSGLIEPIILFMINFIGNIIQNIFIPLIMIFTSLVVISNLSEQVKIDKITKMLKSGVVLALGVILTIFVGVISLEGTISSSVDGITAKTAKAVVSSAIPVVGKILGDAVDTVLGCGIILKNAIGFVGIVIIIGICVIPIIKLLTLTFAYKLLAGVTQPIADKKITELLEQIGDIFKIFLAILSSISFLIIIGTGLVLKISNTGMMYR